jgi:cell division protein FtsQ
MWLVICTGMLTLLIAAMRKQKAELCKGYEISIKGERSTNFFLDKQAIAKLLKTAAKGSIKGQSKTSFDLLQLEQLLEDNVWIKDAQLYFDNKAVLHITVEEREPIARVFTTGGQSFYIDNSEQVMPLSDKAIAKVPVFTGYPDRKGYTSKDSALIHDINTTAKYISTHPFWAAQVAQVDINSECGANCWEFEMIPVAGRHLVKLGNGENIDQKFQRLFAFYQQVMGRSGLDHYKTIDVRFAGQVVAGKSNTPKVDSLKFSKDVEQLLHQAKQQYEEELKAETTAEKPVIVPVAKAATQQADNKIVKTQTKQTQDNNDDIKPTDKPKRPKAVMTKRQE